MAVNGSLFGFFDSKNGLRQGDPISTSLFVLMVEALSRHIHSLQEMEICKGVVIHEELKPIIHSQFADDATLFGEATLREAKVIKDGLDLYAKATGQRINNKKSEVFFFNTKKVVQIKISKELAWQIGRLATKYLGVPKFSSASKTKLWEDLIAKCKQKADAWKHK